MQFEPQSSQSWTFESGCSSAFVIMEGVDSFHAVVKVESGPVSVSGHALRCTAEDALEAARLKVQMKISKVQEDVAFIEGVLESLKPRS
jgi:hypothetical protein